MNSSEMNLGDFGVTLLGRSGMRYREGPKTVFVDGEILSGAFDFVIYKSSIQAWEASKELISESERDRIVANIKNVCSNHGLKLDVE